MAMHRFVIEVDAEEIAWACNSSKSTAQAFVGRAIAQALADEDWDGWSPQDYRARVLVDGQGGEYWFRRPGGDEAEL